MKENRKHMTTRDTKLFKETILGDPDFQRRSEIRAIDEAVVKDLNKKRIHKPLSANERLIFSH